MLVNLPEWNALENKHAEMVDWTLRNAFESDRSRVADFTLDACGIRFDFSKHLMDSELRQLLMNLAAAREVPAGVAAMLRGDRINQTENRSVPHCVAQTIWRFTTDRWGRRCTRCACCPRGDAHFL